MLANDGGVKYLRTAPVVTEGGRMEQDEKTQPGVPPENEFFGYTVRPPALPEPPVTAKDGEKGE